MNNRPLPAAANPNGNWFHDRFTVTLPIAGIDIEMEGMKAHWTVIPVCGSSALR